MDQADTFSTTAHCHVADARIPRPGLIIGFGQGNGVRGSDFAIRCSMDRMAHRTLRKTTVF
jgi:hypothetical protein